MAMTSPLDPARATVTLSGDGSVAFTDPDGAWSVKVWTRRTRSRTRIRSLRVDVRDPAHPVTKGRLAALPLGQLLHVAAREEAAMAHPNEAFYRMLATPKPAGQRHWDDGHWTRVLQVYDWARASRRPGGGLRAIADMWEVALDPTAIRWLAEARQRAREQES